MSEVYDSKKDTHTHQSYVAVYLGEIINALVFRADNHDSSKLQSPEKELFDKYTPLLKETKYGSDQYKKYLKEMGSALDHHYENNLHHPEHFENGICDMSLVDIIEMFCDWKAASMRMKDGDFTKSLELNTDRFSVGNQLRMIFENTAKLFEEIS